MTRLVIRDVWRYGRWDVIWAVAWVLLALANLATLQWTQVILCALIAGLYVRAAFASAQIALLVRLRGGRRDVASS